MGRLPKDLEEKRLRLMGAVHRGAFDSYIRRGRVPDFYDRIAAVAREAKALDPEVSLDTLTPVKPARRPTTHYVWRTAGDDRVRGAHAVRNGQIFAWNDPPEHGHPGREPNCRCWPEPYYGDPAVPDALLTMVSERRVSTNPGVLWASIDTVTRPDGSLAASNIVMTDGARIQSSFVGQETLQAVTSPGQPKVSVHTRGGQQAVYLAGEATPAAYSAWQNAPVSVAGGRTRVAFQDFSDPFSPRNDVFVDPGGMAGAPLPGAGGIAAAVLALLEIYNGLNEEATSLGASKEELSFVAFKAWALVPGQDDERLPTPVMVGSLDDERVRQACKRLLEVQQWTNAAARSLAHLKPLMGAAGWGTIVHTALKRTVDALKAALPVEYADVIAELSLTMTPEEGVFYSQSGTIRVDLAENRTEEAGAVCIYDIKTGREGLTAKRLMQIARFVAKNYGAVIFYIVEVRPEL